MNEVAGKTEGFELDGELSDEALDRHRPAMGTGCRYSAVCMSLSGGHEPPGAS